MSGGTTMYTLKPIISLPSETNQSKTMYRMKNIHGEHREPDDHASHESKIVSGITEQDPLPEVAILEARQEKILAQLAQLKEQVSSLCNVLKESSQTKPTVVSGSEETIRVYIAVNANSTRPPYSLVALQKIWTQADLRITTHVHSTVVDAVPELPISRKRSISNIIINTALIWKNVPELELVLSPVRGHPLLGEVNLLRYLSRLITIYNYENIDCPGEIDAILDLCHRLPYENSSKEKQAILFEFSKKLGKDKWFLGFTDTSIADVAVWSTIKQINFGKLPLNLTEWFARCDKVFLST
ncbi:aminoacyl tRNA synthase complex-interacting multifunctional protein 2 isoform X2 [Cephus cinctus]|uniref:Aminoacyl tRNA synthase complex-interacting multifunctional protein 2 isoform X2 n=1 Tax=Cephus cinctus TaxID=211228 RepID=A0AAJ7C7A6_CEPCN|nr:aminoacyl tRNA synthase complex-interacting multifunctional protein 2 isoform X2 [Cephus cinctus]